MEAGIVGGQAQLWSMAVALHDEHSARSAKWFYRRLIGKGAPSNRRTRLTGWQAFVSMNAAAHNEGKVCSPPLLVSFLTDFVLDRDKKERAPAIAKALQEEWNSMSAEEKQDATEEYIEGYEDERDDRTTRVSNVNLGAFHDVQRTLRTMEETVRLIYRTSLA
jgi:hypothetical protein